MEMAFHKKYWIKYFNHSLLQTNRTRNGLGLSLSYDIVKAHGGELKVEQRKENLVSLLFNYQLLLNIKYAQTNFHHCCLLFAVKRR
jgi:K+-sensing histidine kinase KdpD